MKIKIKLIVFTLCIGLAHMNKAMDAGEALQEAAADGDSSTVDQILSTGTVPNGCTAFSPLYCAIMNKQDDVIEKLLNAGAKVDQDIFVLAAEYGRIDILERGLENPGVDINMPDTVNQQTALQIAKLHEQEEAHTFLLERLAGEE